MKHDNLTGPIYTVGIIMPNDFPKTKYEAIHKHCEPKIKADDPPRKEWNEYMAAWNAVAYRFRAMAEHDEKFREALSGKTRNHRYIQEKELFGFFVAGLSTLEAFSYGTHFILSIVYRNCFPVEKLRSITIRDTLKCLEKSLPLEPLALRLRGLAEDITFIDWEEIRNILAHRGAPGRVISVGTLQGDVWKLKNIPISPNITRTRRAWLANTLSDLLDKLYLFFEKHT